MKAASFAALGATAGALSLLVLASFPAQAQETLPLSDYQKLVRSYQSLASRPKPDDDALASLVKRLRDVKTITLPRGKTMSVDLSADAEALETGNAPVKGKKPYETAARRSSILSLVVVPDGDAPKAENAPAQAAAILARPEFQVKPEAKDTTPGWIKAVRDWFAKEFRAFGRWIAYWWERLFPAPPSVNPGAMAVFASFMQFLLYFLVAVGVLIGLYFLGMYLTGKNWNQKKRTGGSGGTGLDLDLNEFPDPLGYAREVAARGDYREAVRLVYIASLRRLAGSGLVTLQENRTNWEYQRSLRSRSQTAYDTLLPGTRLFDRIWYGRQNATREEYDQSVALHDALPEPVVTAAAPGGTGDKPLAGAGKTGKGGNGW